MNNKHLKLNNLLHNIDFPNYNMQITVSYKNAQNPWFLVVSRRFWNTSLTVGSISH
jgi:hypothetical protein